MTVVRRLLVVEAVAFAAAALTHFGILPLGLDDPTAGTAESIIMVVVLAALAVGAGRPAWARRAALLAQAFALAGTTLGLYLFMRLQPDKTIDIVFHGAMVILLMAGLVLAARASGSSELVS